MTCPSCDKINKCNCSNCNNNDDLIILLIDEGLYQCCFCGYKFNEQDSLDYDWDKMIKGFADRISPDMCLIWATSNRENQIIIEKESNDDSFAFEQAFAYHFGKSYKYTSSTEIELLKLQVKRELSLEYLLKQ